MQPVEMVDLFAGSDELSSLMRAKDWSQTPLGPPEHWPQSLKTCVRIILTSRQPMFVWWGDHLINLYNDAYKTIVGGKHPAALGQPASVVWAEIWDQVGPRAESAMRHNEGTYDEALLLIMERYGYPEETYYTFSYSPVPNDMGGTGGIICANSDDTQRIIGRRQLALLRELGNRMAEARSPEEACRQATLGLGTNLLDLPFALIYLMDAQRNSFILAGTSGIEPGEPAAPQSILAGQPHFWSLAEVIKKNAAQLLPVIDKEQGTLPKGLWDRSPSQRVALPLAPQGETGRVGVLVAGLNPYRLYEADYQSFLGLVAGQIGSGIANAQAYEEERKRAEALAEIDRAKTAFFSNVSHEFRTPLTLMLAPLEDALKDQTSPPLSEVQRERLDVAHRNSLRLLRLVNTLLDFSRIEAGRAQANYRRTDLGALTTDLASSFQSAVEKAGLFLHIDCPELPEPVYVDHDMWEKVILNLLSNAFKFTFEGGINVTLRAVSGSAVLNVSDTGVGVPAEELPRLFERFHRIEGQRSRSFEGSGIGLALVHELVRLHGGSIEAQSEPGKGTEFTITIPFGTTHLETSRIDQSESISTKIPRIDAFVEEALHWLPGRNAETKGTESERASPYAQHQFGASRPLLLLVDDNSDMRDYVCRLMEEFCDVVTALNGQMALDLIRERRPDLVLSDIMMPVLDGFGLLREIRGDPALRDLPVILLSARAGEEARVEGLNSGADDYVLKPFAAHELRARICANLSLAQLRREAVKSLAESEAELKAIFETVPVGIVMAEAPSGKILKGNRQAEMILGHPILFSPDVESYKDWVSYHPDGRQVEGHEYPLARALAGEERPELEVQYQHGDGRKSWVKFIGAPIRTDGRITGGIVASLDIDREKRALQALDQIREDLELRVVQEVQAREAAQASLAHAQRLEALGQLAGGVAHDFNNVLQAVMGGLRLIEKRVNDQTMVRQFCRMAGEAAERGAAITGRLLTFARRGELRAISVSPSVLLESLRDILAPTLGSNIRIKIEVGGELSPFIADKAQLETVLINLAVNARDAMPEGGVLTLEAHEETVGEGQSHPAGLPEGAFIRLCLTDTGVGMDAATLNRAAEPFFTTKPEGEGTGLGLAMARGFAQQSGGGFEIRSTPGEGTTVVLWFPQKGPGSEYDGTAPTLSLEPLRVPHARVLLADDDPIVLEVLKGQLEEVGFEVIQVSNGQAALEKLDSGKLVDLLVTDLSMPGMNGLALIGAARQRLPQLPAILLTGYANASLQLEGALTGPTILLRKPVADHELVKRATALLNEAYEAKSSAGHQPQPSPTFQS